MDMWSVRYWEDTDILSTTERFVKERKIITVFIDLNNTFPLAGQLELEHCI